jgi:amino-acid N-acetyltransferase
LIAANLQEGHLLPREVADIERRASRFVVATRGRRVVGCAELAPLSVSVGEIRSLVVHEGERGHGVGAALTRELRDRARREGFEKLCAFTHAPAYFTRMGFSIVPHAWLLEKVTTDCIGCPLFRTCGKYAMVVPVGAAEPAFDDAPAAAARPAATSWA